jgi:hypothetical protein
MLRASHLLQPAQIFANFGFMSILATLGTDKQDPKKKTSAGFVEKEMR